MASSGLRRTLLCAASLFASWVSWSSQSVYAFDNTRNDNLAVYWGQDSSGFQQRLSFYCADDTYNAIPVAFLYVFFGPGGEPQINFANICSAEGNPVFNDTLLANCTFLEADIKTCQSKGKIVTLSIGGATGAVGFQNNSQAVNFADQVWNEFLGGNSSTRPFGDAILDGIDLDIEGGSPEFYGSFVNRVRNHTTSANKTYYVTAAPQCPFPDANVGTALDTAPFDAVYVQFYNNDCGLDHPQQYNLATWDKWAKTKSPNPNVKVYIGAPGSAASAGTGYVDVDTLRNYALAGQANYSSFGGVMLWDASSAYVNNRYDVAIKEALVAVPEVQPTVQKCVTVDFNAWGEVVMWGNQTNARLRVRDVGRVVRSMATVVRRTISSLRKRAGGGPKFSLHRHSTIEL